MNTVLSLGTSPVATPARRFGPHVRRLGTLALLAAVGVSSLTACGGGDDAGAAPAGGDSAPGAAVTGAAPSGLASSDSTGSAADTSPGTTSYDLDLGPASDLGSMREAAAAAAKFVGLYVTSSYADDPKQRLRSVENALAADNYVDLSSLNDPALAAAAAAAKSATAVSVDSVALVVLSTSQSLFDVSFEVTYSEDGKKVRSYPVTEQVGLTRVGDEWRVVSYGDPDASHAEEGD